MKKKEEEEVGRGERREERGYEYFIINCGAVELWGNANTLLQGISLKVPEHDGELNQVH